MMYTGWMEKGIRTERAGQMGTGRSSVGGERGREGVNRNAKHISQWKRLMCDDLHG